MVSYEYKFKRLESPEPREVIKIKEEWLSVGKLSVKSKFWNGGGLIILSMVTDPIDKRRVVRSFTTPEFIISKTI